MMRHDLYSANNAVRRRRLRMEELYLCCSLGRRWGRSQTVRKPSESLQKVQTIDARHAWQAPTPYSFSVAFTFCNVIHDSCIHDMTVGQQQMPLSLRSKSASMGCPPRQQQILRGMEQQRLHLSLMAPEHILRVW